MIQKNIKKIKLSSKDTVWHLTSFLDRLIWHCHFMQKLESYPELEFTNVHPHYDSLSRKDDKTLYSAWSTGQTGYPMIDACMRALIAHGWINFRMRAMLISFASYHLWLDWKKTSLHLARMFVDYEPGIHYSQIQMQSGTTGTNSIRIYNPIKQGMDHDPEGIFIKKWLPELRDIDTKHIHFPWKEVGANIYPRPIVNEAVKRKEAQDEIYEIRKFPGHEEISREILKKYSSTRSGIKSTVKKRKKKKINFFTPQLELFKL